MLRDEHNDDVELVLQPVSHLEPPPLSEEVDQELLLSEGEPSRNGRRLSHISDLVFQPRSGRSRKNVAFLLVAGLITLVALLASFSFSKTSPPLPVDTTAPTVAPTSPPVSPPVPLWSAIRLPAQVAPSHYELHLTPTLKPVEDVFRFDGALSIDLVIADVIPPRVVLHSLDLDLMSAKLRSRSDEPDEWTADAIVYNTTLQLANIVFGDSVREIVPGNYTLDVQFSGDLQDNLVGFYRSSYADAADGTTRFLATTQFEAVFARRAFPCFDEPALKATFAVSLLVQPEFTALANMPLVAPATADGTSGWMLYRFQTTPPMSTYLVAYVVGDLESTEVALSGDVSVQVWTRPGIADEGVFARDVAVDVLQYYGTLFAPETYPLPKCDLVAIPDFEAGAMENWGLVTFRETAVLYNEETASLGDKQWVAVVVAHELAHQYFGDLVTMEWWDDLWLNEGFASFMEFLGAGHFAPYMNMDSQFVSDALSVALKMDSSPSSHPILASVEDPAEISEIFDGISYSKGAALLHGLWESLGEDTFFEGVASYLGQHRYANAKTEDLWHSLQHASGKDIPAMMHSWTSQMGYPLLTLSRTPVTSSPGQFDVSVSQRWFVSVAHEREEGDAEPLWWLLFKYSTAQDLEPVALDVGMQRNASLGVRLADDEWMKIRSGYYRVDYGELWPALLSVVNVTRNVFEESERAALLDDVLALAFSLGAQHGGSDVTPHTALAMARALLTGEQGLVPWEVAMPHTGWLRRVAQGDAEVSTALQSLMQELMWSALEGLGLEHGDDTSWSRRTRAVLYAYAEDWEMDAVRTHALTLFQSLRDGDAAPGADFFSAAVCAGMRTGDQDTFDWMKDRFINEPSPSLQKKYLRGLACSPDVGQLQSLLELSLTDDVREQDAFILIQRVAANPVGGPLAWSFFQREFDRLCELYCLSISMSRVVRSVLGWMHDAEHEKEAEEFFAEHSPGSAQRAVQQSLERVRTNRLWLTAYLEDVRGTLLA